MSTKRQTIQRQMVMEAVKKLRTHPTTEDVYMEIQKEHPSISKATVYRNLHQLVECGSIKRVLLPNSPDRYEENMTSHYHFRCRICGTTLDVDAEFPYDIDEKVRQNYKHLVEGHELVFQGVCDQCRAGQLKSVESRKHVKKPRQDANAS